MLLCMCAYIHTYLENSVRFLNHSSLVRRQVNNTVGSVEQRELEFGSRSSNLPRSPFTTRVVSLVSGLFYIHSNRTRQAAREWLHGMHGSLAACWHSLCGHAHDNVLRFILYVGFLQSLNVAFTELHIGLGVAKLTGVVVNVLDSHVQLCGSGERITGRGIPST